MLGEAVDCSLICSRILPSILHDSQQFCRKPVHTLTASPRQNCYTTPMGHDVHFLRRLQEVDASHVDTAMMLYKDPALLHAVLQRLELPEGAERVALSLADPLRGPFIVVQRDGHFVTCLREGMMTNDLPIVPRGRLDAVVTKIESLRERWQAAVALTGGKNVSRKLMHRLATAGQSLSREEFLAISAMQPLLIWDIYDLLGQTLDTLDGFRRQARRPAFMRHLDAKALDLYWSQRCLVSHLTVLFAMDCQDFLKAAALSPEALFGRFIAQPMGQNLLGLSVITAWAASKLGKYVLPVLKQFHSRPPTPLLVWYTGPALLGIASRSASYRGEIAKVFERLPELDPELDEEKRDAIRTVAELLRAVLSNVVYQGDPEGWFANEAGAEYLSLSAHLPADSPLRYEASRAVPEELVIPAVATSERDLDTVERLKTMVIASARIARVEASELYFPDAVLKQLIGPMKNEDVRRILLSDSAMTPAREPARAAPRPGRNDPCPCGSGNKFKRCCGVI